MNLTPIVIEQNGRGERSYDIYSRLLQDRIIILFGEITDTLSASIISQLLFLASVNETKDIYLYINSPGGSVSAGLAIYDTMKYIKPRVVTIGIGMCASMGAVLLSSGDERMVLENTKVMIHQPLGGCNGQASDIVIVANEIIRIKQKLYEILAKNTKKSTKEIEIDCERDHYLDANEAKDYGLIDEILQNKRKITENK